MEPFYPLHAYVCDECFLVQLEEFVSPEDIFTEYAYFSSYADSWVEHMRRYADLISDRLGARQGELRGRGGEQRWLPAPALRSQEADPGARASSPRPTWPRWRWTRESPPGSKFFGEATGAGAGERSGKQADLICGANVLAQVPRPNDFVRGLKTAPQARRGGDDRVPASDAADGGEPVRHHLPRALLLLLLPQRRDDLRPRTGLVLFDVEELPTHGGSLRVYARHAEDTPRPVTERARAAAAAGGGRRAAPAGDLRRLRRAGEGDQAQAARVPHRRPARREDGGRLRRSRARGTPCSTTAASGPTSSTSPWTAVRTSRASSSPEPTSPSSPRTSIREVRPDYVLILPWNLQEEIVKQMADVRSWGGKFVVPIPEVRVLD